MSVRKIGGRIGNRIAKRIDGKIIRRIASKTDRLTGSRNARWTVRRIVRSIANKTGKRIGVPIVVRLQGTNVEEGRRLLAQAKRLNLISVDDLEEAARKVVELAK